MKDWRLDGERNEEETKRSRRERRGGLEKFEVVRGRESGDGRREGRGNRLDELSPLKFLRQIKK